MIRIIHFIGLTTSLICTSIAALSQTPDPDSLIDGVVRFVLKESIYAHAKDTSLLRDLVREKAKGAQKVDDLRPAFEALLNELGDFHGRIMRSDYSSFAQFTAWATLKTEDSRPRDGSIWQIVNRTDRKFECFQLGKKTALLRIAGISADADQEYEARLIRDAIDSFANKGGNRWVLDLRYNGGGNMYPMFQGLVPLLGNGIVGHSTGANDEVQAVWHINESNFAYDDYQPFAWPPADKSLASHKVAVLTSRYTVSSGEALAVAFKGRSNTRFFGEASGALTTVLSLEPIADTFIVAVSTAHYANRNLEVYKVNVPVDEETPFIADCSWQKDPAIEAALKWLKKK